MPRIAASLMLDRIYKRTKLTNGGHVCMLVAAVSPDK